MTNDHVRGWLDRYVAAWASYDPEAIGDPFTTDAEYRYHPSDPPITGRAAIVRAWTEPSGDASARDEPGTWDAHYEPFAVDGERAVAVGSSRYYTDPTKATVRDVYDNVYLLEFDPRGRCRSFTEFFIERPKERH
jgi:hypothetical protein